MSDNIVHTSQATQVVVADLLNQASATLGSCDLKTDLHAFAKYERATSYIAAASESLAAGMYPMAKKVSKHYTTISAIRNALKQGKRLTKDDVTLAKGIVVSLKDIADSLAFDGRALPLQVTANRDAEDANITAIESVMQSIRLQEPKIKALPKSVKLGKFVFRRAPIIIFTKTRIPTQSFHRSGIKDYSYIPSGLNYKSSSSHNVHGYLIEEQVLLGFDPQDSLLDSTRKTTSKVGRLLEKDKRQYSLKVTPGAITEALDQLSARLGTYQNALLELDPPYFKIAGNPLAWVWALPVRTAKEFVPNLVEISTPKLSATAPEQTAEQDMRTRRAMQRELNDLVIKKQYFDKKGMTFPTLDEVKLNTLTSILSEPLPDRTLPASKLATLKREAEEEIKTKLGAIQAKIEDLKDIIKNEKDATLNMKHRKDLRALSLEFETKRTAILAKYRKKL